MTLDPGRVQAVFLAASEQESAAGRIAVLEFECAEDAELRRRVESLLIAHDKPDGPLGRSLLGPGAAIPARPAVLAEEDRPPRSDPEHEP
jgi:hypothetical protein